MTDAAGGSLWKVGVDTSGVDKGLSSTASKSKSLGDQVERDFGTRGTGAMGKFGGVLDGIGKKVGGLGQTLKASPISNGILQGVGLGAGMLAFNGVGMAIQGVLGFMGDATKAAREDAASVDHLTTSLKANVPAWNGNTGAIDAFIAKGQDLAFTDDDIRDSLAQLVTRTHDVKKAMDLTRVAMDLARLKGVSLATAQGIVGKVYSGNVGILGRFGIAVDKNATSTEALAAIQKAAAGQAETYAKSDAGRADRMADKWAETQEKIGQGLAVLQGIGTKVLGVVVDAVSGLIDGIGNLGTAFDNLHRFIDSSYKSSQDQSNALRELADQYGFNYESIVKFTEAQRSATAAQADAVKVGHEQDLLNTLIDEKNRNIQSDLSALATAYAVYGISMADVVRLNREAQMGTTSLTAAQDENAEAQAAARLQLIEYAKATGLANILTYANAAATHGQAKAFNDSGDAASDARTQYGRLVEHNQRLAEFNARLTDSTNSVRGAFGAWGGVLSGTANRMRNFTGSWRGDWINVVHRLDLSAGSIRDLLKGMRRDTNQQLKELEWDLSHPHQKERTLHHLQTQMVRAMKDLKAAQKNGDADLIAEAQRVVDSINAKMAQLSGSVTFRVNTSWRGGEGTGARPPGGGSGVRAMGGPIWPGEWIVGEDGPERMRINPNGRGYVWPNKGGASASSGTSTVRHEFGTINVRVDGSVAPAAARDIGRGIGDRLGEVITELGRMRPQPVGSAIG